MRFFQQTDNPNTVVGIFLLIVLAVFAGPNALPSLLSSIPFADEGMPCIWLKQGMQRENHQSLIGRAASTVAGDPPVSLRVLSSPIPSDPASEWVIRVVLTNDTVGTIPIVVNTFAIVGDNGQPGIGIVINNPGQVSPGTPQQPAPDSVRLLGPRQRCVQRISIAASQLATLGLGPTSTVKAYYRSTTPGSTGGAGIYPDLGLWVGVVESELQQITFSAGT
jgi:hypothetical protein